VRHLVTPLEREYVLAPDRALPDLLAEAIDRTRADHEGRATCRTRVYQRRPSHCCGGRRCGRVFGVVREPGDHRARHAGRSHQRRAACGDGGPDPGGDVDRARADGQPGAHRSAAAGADQQHEHTNQPGGYWIAATNPLATHQAVTGAVLLRGPGRVRRPALPTELKESGRLHERTCHAGGRVLEVTGPLDTRELWPSVGGQPEQRVDFW
jgi:hypothetical protein